MIHMAMVKDVMYGKTMRKSYAKYEEILEIPNMLKIQKDSYQWFLETGLREVFKDVGTITDFSGKLELSFLDYTMEDKPKYTIEECKERDATYAKPIKVRVRLRNTETDEIKEQEIFMGDFPVMTNGGTFVINGAERVIISQIVRSPGMYYGHEVDKADQHTYTATVIPYRGAWLEYETDNANVFWVRIDKNRKLPITCLIRALGVQTDEQIKQMFGEDARILATIDKDPCKTREESLLEIYRRLRPGEPPTVETATAHLEGLLFDAHRYDVSTVGRYKFNKKMDIWSRLSGQEAAEPITDPMTGEILVMPGEFISRAQAHELSRKGVNEAVIKVGDTNVKVFSNNMVWMDAFVDFDPKAYGVREKVHFPVLKEMLETVPADGWKDAIADRMDDLIPKHIIVDDIMASINYLNCVAMGVGTPDDIDHLGNRRLRCVGELLQNQFRIGFSRLDRVIRERMTVQDLDAVTPQSLINIRLFDENKEGLYGSTNQLYRHRHDMAPRGQGRRRRGELSPRKIRGRWRPGRRRRRPRRRHHLCGGRSLDHPDGLPLQAQVCGPGGRQRRRKPVPRQECRKSGHQGAAGHGHQGRRERPCHRRPVRPQPGHYCEGRPRRLWQCTFCHAHPPDPKVCKARYAR